MKGPLCAMIVLGLVGYGFGANRECYLCSYAGSAASDIQYCEAPSASTKTTTCDGQCQNVVTELAGDISSITRMCAPNCKAGCVEAGGSKVCTTCCDSDLCSGAGSVTFNLVAMFSLIATAWGLSK